MSRAPSNPVPKSLLQDYDIGSYSHDASVDMSGYIPLSKRFDESKIKSKPDSKPFLIDKKLDGSVPRGLQRSGAGFPLRFDKREGFFNAPKQAKNWLYLVVNACAG